MNEKAEPVVCKLDSYRHMMNELKRREREKNNAKVTVKQRKEIQIGAGIARHDLESKISKIKELLNDGHPVKIIVAIKNKKSAARLEPDAMDVMILNVLEYLGNEAASVQTLESNIPTRRDLIVTPKKK